MSSSEISGYATVTLYGIDRQNQTQASPVNALLPTNIANPTVLYPKDDRTSESVLATSAQIAGSFQSQFEDLKSRGIRHERVTPAVIQIETFKKEYHEPDIDLTRYTEQEDMRKAATTRPVGIPVGLYRGPASWYEKAERDIWEKGNDGKIPAGIIPISAYATSEEHLAAATLLTALNCNSLKTVQNGQVVPYPSASSIPDNLVLPNQWIASKSRGVLKMEVGGTEIDYSSQKQELLQFREDLSRAIIQNITTSDSQEMDASGKLLQRLGASGLIAQIRNELTPIWQLKSNEFDNLVKSACGGQIPPIKDSGISAESREALRFLSEFVEKKVTDVRLAFSKKITQQLMLCIGALDYDVEQGKALPELTESAGIAIASRLLPQNIDLDKPQPYETVALGPDPKFHRDSSLAQMYTHGAVSWQTADGKIIAGLIQNRLHAFR